MEAGAYQFQLTISLAPTTGSPAITAPEHERALSRAVAPEEPAKPRATELFSDHKRLSPEAIVAIARRAAEGLRRSPRTAIDSFPSGVQTTAALSQLVESGLKVSGLVVRTAAGTPSQTEADARLAEAVHSAVEGVLEPGDFAASIGENQFVMISPAARGAAAQQRLSRLSQRLWDIQLSHSEHQIQFIWDGLEVREESIQAAMESAAERLRETARSRNLVSQPLTGPIRR